MRCDLDRRNRASFSVHFYRLGFDFVCITVGVGSDLSCIEVLKEPFFSSKFLKLIGILSSARLDSISSLLIVYLSCSHALVLFKSSNTTNVLKK